MKNLLFHKGRKNGRPYVTFEKVGNIGDCGRISTELFEPCGQCKTSLNGGPCVCFYVCRKEFTNTTGNGVGLTPSDVHDGYGCIEFDGDYDKVYTADLKDLDYRELQALLADNEIDLIRDHYSLNAMLDDFYDSIKTNSLKELISII